MRKLRRNSRDLSKVTKLLPEEPGLEHAGCDAYTFLPLDIAASAKDRPF